MKLWVVAFIFFVSVGDANAGPYCGVYSLYGAAKSLGIDANLNDLCTAEYVTSKAGSSAQDLQRAGHALGIRVQPLTGLGRSILLSSQHPLILHVSPRGVHGVYNHWILFLGFENGAAIVHDGSGGSLHCTLEEILARWDGIALVINRLTEPSTTYVSWNAGWLFMLATIGFLICLFVQRCVLRIVSFKSRCLAEIALFTVIAVVCRLVDTSAVATDYNSICIVRRGIDASYQLIDFAEVNKEVVFQLRESKSCVLLDTRYVADFEKGSIPGALSLSLDSGLGEFNRQLESLDKTRLVVLFCQSKHCHFSDYVAAMLTAKGFLDVRIFRGGIEEWFNES